jgi:hypothetical protein
LLGAVNSELLREEFLDQGGSGLEIRPVKEVCC